MGSKFEIKKEVVELRVYHLSYKHTIECFNETHDDGKEFITFYICDESHKMFCVGLEAQNVKDEKEELELAKSIFDDYLPLFNEELDALEFYYDAKFEETSKD